jgi:hypothetical protein
MKLNTTTDYTHLYKNILSSLAKDKFSESLSVAAAKKITDCIWDILLVFDSEQKNLVNTRAKVIEYINNL